MKKKLTKIMLFMLPFMAFILATTNNSVELIDMTTGEKVAGSYFSLLTESPAAVCPALAAFCSIFSCLAAAFYLFKKKPLVLSITAWISFAGACIAVIPVAARGENLLLPNVLFPILLMAHFILCAFSQKMNLNQQEKPQGRRLEIH